MKPAAHFILHFLYRLRSHLHRGNQDAGMTAAQRKHNAAHILHSSVIRMRSRLQSF